MNSGCSNILSKIKTGKVSGNSSCVAYFEPRLQKIVKCSPCMVDLPE